MFLSVERRFPMKYNAYFWNMQGGEWLMMLFRCCVSLVPEMRSEPLEQRDQEGGLG